jgi:pimeloyl-ACP methyl ester carboxylesterase/DNA-binding CsgD family transcriptional regulator
MDVPPFQYTPTTDGVRIAYTRQPGEGTPMVAVSRLQGPPPSRLVHIPLFLEFHAALRGPQPIVGFDWRGSGLSGSFTPPLTIDGLVRDIEAVVQTAGPGPVDLVSFGNGCFAACLYAERHPERVRSLTMQAPALRFGLNPAAPLMALSNENYGLSVRSTTHFQFDYKNEPLARAVADATLAGVPQASWLGYQAVLAEVDLASILPGIRVPALVIADRQPEFLRIVALAADVAALIPGAQFVSIDGGPIGRGVGDDLRRCRENFLGMEPWSPPATAGDGVTAGEAGEASKLVPLTIRETEVLKLLAAGHTNQQIAGELDISLATAARHVANIYPKIGVTNRAEATGFAFRQGLVRVRGGA